MELEVGTIVRAIAGRDADGYFVVTALDGEFVWIADGDRRKLDKPKHKRRKHLRRTCTVMDLNGITDKKLRTLRVLCWKHCRTQCSVWSFPTSTLFWRMCQVS